LDDGCLVYHVSMLYFRVSFLQLTDSYPQLLFRIVDGL
jgi:hypothetical protein